VTEDEKAVAQLLYQHRRAGEEPASSWGRKYEDWSYQHPVLDFAANQALNFALSEIPFARIAKGIPGLRNIGEILESAGRMHDWGGGAEQHIAEPKLKWGQTEEQMFGGKSVKILNRETGEPVGHMDFSISRPDKTMNIDWAEINNMPEDVGTGHLLHIKDELLQRYPDVQKVRFMRLPKEGDPPDKPMYEVTMPVRSGTGFKTTRTPVSDIGGEEGEYTPGASTLQAFMQAKPPETTSGKAIQSRQDDLIDRLLKGMQ